MRESGPKPSKHAKSVAQLVADAPLQFASHKAAVVRDALMPALIALVDVATQRRRAAALDRGHDAALRGGQGRVVPLAMAARCAPRCAFSRWYLSLS